MSSSGLVRGLAGSGLGRDDLALLSFVGFALVAFSYVHALWTDRPWSALLLLGLALSAVYLRGRRPSLALLLALMVLAAWPGYDPVLLPALIVLYSLATARGWRAGAVGATLVAATVIVAELAHGDLSGNHRELPGLALSVIACSVAAVVLGLYFAGQRRVVDAMRERAALADREGMLLAARAETEERMRIARELHDVVAHDVSLMVVQAQALGATTTDHRVGRSTAEIADLGRDAMTEMHRTLRLLRNGPAEAASLDPPPGLADLCRLLARSRAAGMEVELTVEGRWRRLSPSVDLSAFRIVQEALTNVVKHAGAAPAAISIAFGRREVRVAVIDDGPAGGAGELATPGGHGISGMRERVELFGGTLRAGPRSDRGFEVVATLPYAEAGV